jgi:phosphate transport system substrate-binding protein
VSYKQNYLRAFALLFALAAVAPTTVSLTKVQAQSSTDAESSSSRPSIPNGTVVQINSSGSMAKINEALAERFKNKFSGSDVKISYVGTDAALRDVLDGKVDMAAIGRSLSKEEKAKGLMEVPISRNKIAMIVGKDNPFKGNLTIDQFAKMFRGEITDWSSVGGPKAPVRLVDQQEGSDTRQAFQRYPVFEKAPFKSAANATKLPDDITQSVIKQLGKDGIGYVVADQVLNNPDVRILSMHNVLPVDPRYPFSQPLAYVYKGPSPNPVAEAFISNATSSDNQAVVEESRLTNAASKAKFNNHRGWKSAGCWKYIWKYIWKYKSH